MIWSQTLKEIMETYCINYLQYFKKNTLFFQILSPFYYVPLFFLNLQIHSEMYPKLVHNSSLLKERFGNHAMGRVNDYYTLSWQNTTEAQQGCVLHL